MKIAVVGGGSSYTPELMKGLSEISEDIDIDQVWLLDVEEGKDKLETVYSFVERLFHGKFEMYRTLDPVEALEDSDYVIFQFRPGGLKARELDETLPLKYGLIGQETTGVGGFAAALRAFPVIEMYLDLVERYSRAFVVNFTNPSGHITEFVINYLKFDRFVGLCNIPINLIRFVADSFSVDMNDVFLKYYGLNHLTFLERVFIKGEDVTDEIFRKISYRPENVPADSFPGWLIESISLYPNPYLKYYLMKDSIMEKLKTSIPRARQVMEIEDDLMDLYKSADSIPEELSKRGGSMYSTAAAYLIRDLTLGNGKHHIVNIRNEGAITDLPRDYVLEIPAVTRGGRLFPVSMGRADQFALAFIHTLKMYERLTIEAYLKRSRKTALKALLIHPLGPRAENARDLLDDILKAHGIDL